MSTVHPLRRLGLVVHPTRDVAGPVDAVRAWCEAHGATLVPLALDADEDAADAAGCDLLVAIGGDGTALAAIRRAARCGRPVLGVACGSLGALTSVPAQRVQTALSRMAAGDWVAREIPALVLEHGATREHAFNDVALVRESGSQLRVFAHLDGALYARLAGDGAIVSTALGSSAYTIAAGGPLVQASLAAFVLTPLPTHGGFVPPLVIGGGSTLRLQIAAGYAGGRLEIDGRPGGGLGEELTLTLRTGAAELVTFPDQESHLAGLRRRGIVADSPRILADDRRG